MYVQCAVGEHHSGVLGSVGGEDDDQWWCISVVGCIDRECLFSVIANFLELILGRFCRYFR